MGLFTDLAKSAFESLKDLAERREALNCLSDRQLMEKFSSTYDSTDRKIIFVILKERGYMYNSNAHTWY